MNGLKVYFRKKKINSSYFETGEEITNAIDEFGRKEFGRNDVSSGIIKFWSQTA